MEKICSVLCVYTFTSHFQCLFDTYNDSLNPNVLKPDMTSFFVYVVKILLKLWNQAHNDIKLNIFG